VELALALASLAKTMQSDAVPLLGDDASMLFDGMISKLVNQNLSLPCSAP
jgi:hypothetical protein